MAPKGNQPGPERFPPPPPIENDEKGHPKVEQKAPKNDAKKRSKMQKTAPVALFSQPKKNKLFHELFFCLFWLKMNTKIASKVEKIMSKMTLEMKSKKQAQNVLKVMP